MMRIQALVRPVRLDLSGVSVAGPHLRRRQKLSDYQTAYQTAVRPLSSPLDTG